MGKVLYKVPLEHSDLFITHVDLEKATITYTVRDKENGRLLEPESIDSKITVTPDAKFLTDKQNQFLEFIKERHGEQKRKYTGEPYWHHLVNVAKILFDHGHYDLIEVGLGHDLLEDTYCDEHDIFHILVDLKYTFSARHFITNGIVYLTDIYTKESSPELNRADRKSKEAERLSKIPYFFQTVKYADLIDNGRDILKNDPAFAKVYLREKQDLLKVMNQGNEKLYQQALNITIN